MVLGVVLGSKWGIGFLTLGFFDWFFQKWGIGVGFCLVLGSKWGIAILGLGFKANAWAWFWS
jgi:hypothetical protein